MKSKLPILLFSCAFVFAVYGVDKLGRGDEESELHDALMGEEAYIKDRQLGEEFGYFAAQYWRVLVHEHDQAHWDRLIEIHRTFDTDAESERQIKAAIDVGFVVPPNARRDKRLRDNYTRLVLRLPELSRRRFFSQRLKDCLAWIGAASLCVVAGRLISRRSAVDSSFQSVDTPR